jgi:hypothetical protein
MRPTAQAVGSGMDRGQAPEERKKRRTPLHLASEKIDQEGSFRAIVNWLPAIPIACAAFALMTRRKPSRKKTIVAFSFALTWLALLAACGSLGNGGGGSGVVVSVTPSTVSVPVPSGTVPFLATVINASNNDQAVTWTVNGTNGPDANGNISGSGLYTAPLQVPTNSPTITITATSQADPSASGSATVTLTSSQSELTVSPTSITLFENEAGNTWPVSLTQQQFSATVGNNTNPTVTWSVLGGSANGTISANGLYSAPSTVPNPSSVTVTATSSQAGNAGTATVTIIPATPVGTYLNIQVAATAAGGSAHADPVTLTVD